MDAIPTRANARSSSLMVMMGIFWLLLAGALLFYQLTNPVTVKVEWETATELDTAGFYLFRSQLPDGEYEQVNDAMIDSQGSAVSGASYSYVDRDVEPGKTYYYVLEEVQTNAAVNRYDEDMFSYTVPRVTWWAVVLTTITSLVGLALLVSGLREGSV
ncbi:MAG: hypothetical protein KC441_16820 [Anaerolineales bacterium]|nr:hypothetical protein [Anaerolineales bacterium]